MKVIRVKEPPKDGRQFVTIHKHNGEIWGTTHRYNTRGYLETYPNEEDEFETGIGFHPNSELIHLVFEEEE